MDRVATKYRFVVSERTPLWCVLPAVILAIASPTVSEAQVSFNRDIAPILANHCYECHGPDESQRQSGLRLDVRSSAVSPGESGKPAIAAHASAASELVRRIMSRTDERMPPPDTGDLLSPKEIELLRQWIDAGARWQTHWAFEPVDVGRLPEVNDARWSRNPIDRFVFKQLQEHHLKPTNRADSSTLIRRLSFGLLGLPPHAKDVEAFVNEARPDAYERLIERLLASPAYGERWGRHWLDVARYADSNGGDENQAYPLAHRYRDYVIKVLNDDLTYDRFVMQQLAGDLLPPTDDELLQQDRLTATGYLAIGMKILAEQDPIKKRADMVDEQIDTFGRTFLGLSLGCARCHDHKFDPVPTRDYYALAGIFHSSEPMDRPIRFREFESRQALFEQQSQKYVESIDAIQAQLDSAEIWIDREAESFDRGNVVVDHEEYGAEIGIISDPGAQDNFAEYDLEKLSEPGTFLLQIRYAAAQARPGQVKINGMVALAEALTMATGGWQPDAQQWHSEGILSLSPGKHTLRIESKPLMSHLDRIRLRRIGGAEEALWQKIKTLKGEFQNWQQQRPVPTEVMSIADQEIQNTRLHVRGSHLDLGSEVPRGFLSVIGGDQSSIPADTSGRRELARWLTHHPAAVHLTSRVIVNRLWQWHFGRGLVATPDDFGVRGAMPSHPRLLDYLASYLVDHEWSLKAVHRLIVESETYCLSSVDVDPVAVRIDPANRLLWRREMSRLDAEAIRDSLLYHAGELSNGIGNAALSVKSQDPSPEDMRNNLAVYENSRRRSVYLPIVRSNVYEFLTLFDFPSASTPVGKRDQTTIPTQSLWLMNSPFVIRCADAVGRQLPVEDQAVESAIRQLYLHLFARVPTAEEVAAGRSFMRSVATLDISEFDERYVGWSMYCQTLFASNEFVYVK